MARGRVIDREIHRNEDLAKFPIEARYLFIGTVVHADDQGRMKASAPYLKVTVFPFDEKLRSEKVKEWRDNLAQIGLIKLYEVGGTEYLAHPNWSKWQFIRRDRVRPPDCPPPGNQMTTKRQPAVNQRLAIPNLTVPNQTKDKDTVSKSRFQKPTSDQVAEYAKSIGFAINAQQFVNYYESKGWLIGRTPMKDWKAAVRTWKANSNSIVPFAPAATPVKSLGLPPGCSSKEIEAQQAEMKKLPPVNLVEKFQEALSAKAKVSA